MEAAILTEFLKEEAVDMKKAKGQLISKGLFDVIVEIKKPTKNF